MIVAIWQAADYAVYIRPRCTSQAAASPELVDCPPAQLRRALRGADPGISTKQRKARPVHFGPQASPKVQAVPCSPADWMGFGFFFLLTKHLHLRLHRPPSCPDQSFCGVSISDAPQKWPNTPAIPPLRRPKTTVGCPDRDATMRVPHEEPHAATIVGVGLAMTSVCFFSSFLSQSIGAGAAGQKTTRILIDLVLQRSFGQQHIHGGHNRWRHGVRLILTRVCLEAWEA